MIELLVIYGLVVFIGGVVLGSSLERWAAKEVTKKEGE